MTATLMLASISYGAMYKQSNLLSLLDFQDLMYLVDLGTMTL